MKRGSRQKKIMDLVANLGTVDLDHLAQTFDVSKMTIHRDLDELAEEGLLRKVRGGATIEPSLQFESDFRHRLTLDAAAKQAVAQAALDLIEPGMTVMLNDGSTAAMVARMLPQKKPLTVITNNHAVIDRLIDEAGIKLISLGGTYSKKFNGYFGVATEHALERLKADLVFLSSPAFDTKSCFHMDEEVVRTKMKMRAAGMRCYLMVRSEKFSRSALHFLADLTDFDGVIVDDRMKDEDLAKMHQNGVKVIVASGE